MGTSSSPTAGRARTSLPGAYYRFAEAGFLADSISGPQVLKEGEASLTSGSHRRGPVDGGSVPEDFGCLRPVGWKGRVLTA